MHQVDVTTKTWRAEGRTLQPGDRVKVAGRPFNRFVARELAPKVGDGIGCDVIGSITIKKWRSDGYAWLPQVRSGGDCGGSAFGVAVREDGRWSIPAELGGQAPLECMDLSSYSVPPAIYRGQCSVPRGGRLVGYRDWFWIKVDDRGRAR